MDQNNNQNRDDKNRGGGSRGIFSLVLWALVLTFAFQ